jgi:uncharacterized protein (DUF1684 family)
MRRILFTLLLCPLTLSAQNYKTEIARHRTHYKQEFLTDARSPLKAVDTPYLRFFATDEKYKVIADVVLTKDAKPFKIMTHSQKKKDYKEYAVLKFELKGQARELHAYQSIDLANKEQYKDMLFIPFTDNTNSKTTYGGGRYIDLDIKDINEGKIVLDFNKCYNPYCAFADGYSCPIPPRENSLNTDIKAGEKLFGKKTRH